MTPDEAYSHHFARYLTFLTNVIEFSRNSSRKGDKFPCDFTPHFWSYLDELKNLKSLGYDYLFARFGTPADAAAIFLQEFKKVWPGITIHNYNASSYYYTLTIDPDAS